MIRAFPQVASAMLTRPGVEAGRMFGAEGLKIGGKVFAMEVKGALVVKLARDRAEALVGRGDAAPFDPGHGRPMKQWIAVPASAPLDWLELASEALDFVAGAGRANPSPQQ